MRTRGPVSRENALAYVTVVIAERNRSGAVARTVSYSSGRRGWLRSEPRRGATLFSRLQGRRLDVEMVPTGRRDGIGDYFGSSFATEEKTCLRP